MFKSKFLREIKGTIAGVIDLQELAQTIIISVIMDLSTTIISNRAVYFRYLGYWLR